MKKVICSERGHECECVEGEDRSQVTLLPECLDDYVAEDNPVRVIDVFIDALDLTGLGFDGMAPAVTGRPGYHPAVLLKIYVYGYRNRLPSSRRLERETQRNVELMWLTGLLTPDMGVPFVHGALAGFEGQLLTVFPEDPGLKQIYGTGEEGPSGANRPEFLLGVPSITPSLVATLEAMEVLKILLNRGTPFRNKMVYIDHERGEWSQFSFQGE